MPTALPLDSDAPPSASTDAEGERALLRRLRAGDDASFAELVLTYGPRMLAAIRRYLPQDSDSQDALQEAFLSVFKALDQFQGESRLGT
ncbi:MAG: sigma factor, partial [Pirellulaceae bacterium]|nr:sigma factor [Pirellulaceae bacterium]